MSEKSLDFVKKRIASGICDGIENEKNTTIIEADFIEIAKRMKFNKIVQVSENLWEIQLPLESNKSVKILVSYNPDADYDYISSESCYCDGTIYFFAGLCSKIFEKILTGQSLYAPKIPKDAEEYLYNYDISFEVGDFVLIEEYGEQFATKEKPWMQSRFTVMLPIKCDFIKNGNNQ